jgi:hypothetical protein
MSKFLNNIDLNGNSLYNVRLQNLATAPSTSAAAGGIYYDTVGNVIKFHNGTSWITVSVGGPNTYQPLDADLTAIAALTGTAGFLKTNGSGTWSVDTNTYLTSSTGVVSVNGNSGVITGIAVTAGTLGQFAATTSAQLAGVLSDETGFSTGAKSVFNISPTITTSLITDSATFDLINTTATTVNFAGAATAVNIGASNSTTTIAGDLVVNGTTTTINSTTVTVDDLNIVLGSVTTPTNTTANGGGITVAGGVDGNKTWNWVSSTSSWTSSENIDLASGKVLKVAGTQVLSATQYTGNSSTATTATNVTGGAAGSIVYQTGSGATSTLALPTTGTDQVISDFRLVGGSSAPAWSARKFSKTLSGSATSYTLTHLLGTADLIVSVYEVSTGEVMYADVVNTSTTTTVSFATAPTANQYRVVILA